jgi:hypothetical protein
MARKPSIHLPGSLYHLILRGRGRQDTFLADADPLPVRTALAGRHLTFHLPGAGLLPHDQNYLHLVLQAGIIPLLVKSII